MTLARFAFVVCLAGMLISLMMAAVLILQYAPGSSVVGAVLGLPLALKLGAVLLIALALAALTLAVLHRARRRKDDRLALILRILAGASVLVGLLLAFVGLNGQPVTATGAAPAGFGASASAWADAALMLALGFLPAVIALFGAAPVRVARRGL